MSELIIDTRERAITRHANELKNINHRVIQITTADFAICKDKKIVIAIERKTLEDFAASLKDGRSDNKSKLIELREKTNCKLIYIIEGPAFPAENAYFGNIPYKYIESACFHLMIRDNISIIKTSDTLDTVKTLKRLMDSYDRLVEKTKTPGAGATASATADIATASTTTSEPTDMTTTSTTAATTADTTYDIKTLLTAVHVKSDHEICRQMWSVFGGISVESADDYNYKYAILDVVYCIPRAEILAHRMKSGRKISKKAIASLTAINSITEYKLLSAVPGVSVASAKEIVSERSLSQFLSYSIEGMSMCRVGKKCLGKERAARIKRLFEYKFGVADAVAVADVAPAVVAPAVAVAAPAVADAVAVINAKRKKKTN
jgi:ERCC4-type nuclease